MKFGLAASVAGAALSMCLAFASAPALAQGKPTAEEKAAILASETPEEKQERETRRQCAIAAACSAFRSSTSRMASAIGISGVRQA